MIGSMPPIPDGVGPLAVWARWVRDQIFALQPMPSPTAPITRTTRGWSAYPQPAPAAAVAISRYRIKSVQNDYLTCRSWDGTTEGAADVYIAKEPKHRCSLTAATLPDGAHTYSYSTGPDANNTQRTNTNTTTGASEQELITPPWLVNDDVWAMPVSSTGAKDPSNNDIKLLAVGVSRQWASI